MVIAALLTAAFTVPAAAVVNGTLGIRPANESDFFHLSLAPGATQETAAIVGNHSDVAVTLLIYPVDATNTPTGGFAFGSQKDSRAAVGVWSSIAVTRITVKANSELRVPLQVSVPARAVPGDYAGGLVIEAPPVVGSSSQPNKNGVVTRIDVIQRQGVRIYLHVTGKAIAKISSKPLGWKSTGSAVDFTIPVTNTGTTILHPKASLTLTSVTGSAPQRMKFTTPESLLPGQSVTLHARLNNAPLLAVTNVVASVTSEAAAQTLSGNMVLLTWWLVVLILLGVLLVSLGTWRTVRFVRRSREAFRTLARLAGPPTSSS
jgi:hypothetical protein